MARARHIERTLASILIEGIKLSTRHIPIDNKAALMSLLDAPQQSEAFTSLHLNVAGLPRFHGIAIGAKTA